MGGAIPGLVVLGPIRKQAEQAMGSKPVSSTLHGLCISSCLQVPALLVPVLTPSTDGLGVHQMNSFFCNLLLVMVFHHSNSNPKQGECDNVLKEICSSASTREDCSDMGLSQ